MAILVKEIVWELKYECNVFKGWQTDQISGVLVSSCCVTNFPYNLGRLKPCVFILSEVCVWLAGSGSHETNQAGFSPPGSTREGPNSKQDWKMGIEEVACSFCAQTRAGHEVLVQLWHCYSTAGPDVKKGWQVDPQLCKLPQKVLDQFFSCRTGGVFIFMLEDTRFCCKDTFLFWRLEAVRNKEEFNLSSEVPT